MQIKAVIDFLPNSYFTRDLCVLLKSFVLDTSVLVEVNAGHNGQYMEMFTENPI